MAAAEKEAERSDPHPGEGVRRWGSQTAAKRHLAVGRNRCWGVALLKVSPRPALPQGALHWYGALDPAGDGCGGPAR